MRQGKTDRKESEMIREALGGGVVVLRVHKGSLITGQNMPKKSTLCLGRGLVPKSYLTEALT